MVFEKVKEFLEKSFKGKEINLDTKFREDLEADSIKILSVVMDIEDEYNLELDEETIRSMVCVKDLVEYIEKNI
ncbi:MAG: phosphopantetheine-binding protein [Peptoniphilaceae bacterium]|uniref:acyl carrier protein n=1 Tax=Parvimonas sp. TaxID=1944660 RepID=UPI0025F1AEFC|nr:phosphopantetheine-binding protein [Parvimonas sp.]MCI5997777.1 phosphopantetheine-binding protein [Parvimonas sp.]MDD7765298.1 phosphopantetheine-binding protein [Peptoniphilaceae bacterium]MDY3050910.1 phosphopantetheine-binding protein [Parvimonas sp.]